MTAARNLARQGYTTYLVEKDDKLGGQARYLKETWRGEKIDHFVQTLIEQVQRDANINVLLNAHIQNVDGFVGNFKTTVQTDGESILEHGVTIIASGAASHIRRSLPSGLSTVGGYR
mgnify:CR=1 FL=1